MYQDSFIISHYQKAFHPPMLNCHFYQQTQPSRCRPTGMASAMCSSSKKALCKHYVRIEEGENISRTTFMLVSVNKKVFFKNQTLPSLSWSEKPAKTILLSPGLQYTFGCETNIGIQCEDHDMTLLCATATAVFVLLPIFLSLARRCL